MLRLGISGLFLRYFGISFLVHKLKYRIRFLFMIINAFFPVAPNVSHMFYSLRGGRRKGQRIGSEWKRESRLHTLHHTGYIDTHKQHIHSLTIFTGLDF